MKFLQLASATAALLASGQVAAQPAPADRPPPSCNGCLIALHNAVQKTRQEVNQLHVALGQANQKLDQVVVATGNTVASKKSALVVDVGSGLGVSPLRFTVGPVGPDGPTQATGRATAFCQGIGYSSGKPLQVTKHTPNPSTISTTHDVTRLVCHD